MSDLLARLDCAYKNPTLDYGDLWNLCAESAGRIRKLEAGLRDVLDYAQDCAAINDERPPCLESAKKLLEQRQ